MFFMRFAFLSALNKSRYMERERPPCALCRSRLHPSICCFPAFPVWSALWFVPYLSISHSFLLDTALGSALCCLAPFLFCPPSLWKTLCPPVLKFRSEEKRLGNTFWVCCHYTWMWPRLLLLQCWTNEVVFVYFAPNNRINNDRFQYHFD